MKRKDFDALVARMERRHAGRPGSLERATTAWMTAALAAFLAWVGLLFLLGTAAFVGGIILPFEAGIWLLVAGVLLILYATSQAFLLLSVEHEPPPGRALYPGEAPALHDQLESLRRELQCRRFDDVRITMEFNAGIREVPRLGFLGWPRMILQIGLPLMEALTLDELRAVLAHEMAHVSARHARGASRIYRLHRTWTTLFERMQRPASSSFQRSLRAGTVRLAEWYWPRLHARAVVLSQGHEYHADRVAAGQAGAFALATALWRMECLEPRLSERFWPEVFRAAEEAPEPPADVLDRLRVAYQSPPSPADASRWMERALARTTGHDETHPSLHDRSRALGVSADDLRRSGYPAAPAPSAAEALLGDARDAIERQVAADWRRDVAADWRLRHGRAAAEARRRETTGASSASAGDGAPSPVHASASAVDAWESARSSVALRGPAESVPLLRAVLELDPRHSHASYVLGCHLLTLGDPEGRRLLEDIAADGETFWMRQALESLHDHFRTTGQVAELQEMRGRLDRLDADSTAAQRERATVRPDDTFLPHELEHAAIEALRATLALREDCESAWLVRKAMRYFPRRALFVLAVRCARAGWRGADPDRERELVRSLSASVELPGQVLIVTGSGPFRKLARKVARLPGSEIHRRDR